MHSGLITRIMVSLLVFSLCLFSYLGQQNAVTKKRMMIPLLAKELKMIEEENTRLQYQIDQFENPIHLMHLASNHQFSHLKHPVTTDVVELASALALKDVEPVDAKWPKTKSQFALAVGTKK